MASSSALAEIINITALGTQADGAGVAPLLRAEVDDMAMLRLVARDSGWITVLPEVVLHDELREVDRRT